MSFVYDGMGRRPNKYNIATETYTWYRYDAGWNALAVYGPGNDPNTTWDIGAREQGHVYMGMTALAGIIGADPAAGAWGYHLHDHLGSTRRIHNQAKDRIARFDFTPYGEIFHAENPGAAAPRFTGKALDAESGLYHFPYRYYTPQSARWLTRDPLGMVDGPNVCAYVINKPINNIDSRGLSIAILLAGMSLTCCLKEGKRIYHEASEKYPGGYRSYEDHMRHCTASCELAKKKGQTCASLGDLREYLGRYFPGAGLSTWISDGDEFDLLSNSLGRQCAQQSPAASCDACCRKQWRLRSFGMNSRD